MPVEVNWDTSAHVPEKAIIYWSFAETWDWYEFAEANTQAVEMALSVPHRVDSVLDLRYNTHTPDASAISCFTRAVLTSPSNHRVYVVIKPLPQINAAQTVLCRLFPNVASTIATTQTLDDAYAFLNKRRRERSPDTAAVSRNRPHAVGARGADADSHVGR